MIDNVKITNHLGESITIELRFPEKSGFLIRGGIDGLGPSKATINTTEIASNNGAMFNSSRVNQRNIIFRLSFVGNSIETIRQKSYRFFPIGRRIDIEIETDKRICKTYGYIESNEPDIFSKEEGSVISVICPNSYFYGDYKDVTVFSNIVPMFEFPFSNESATEKLIEFGSASTQVEKPVYYSGDAPVGIIIFVHALGSVNNLSILNIGTQQILSIISTKLISLIGTDILAGDDIVISTVRGDKFIVLIRGGVTYNIQNALGKNPGWFQLEKGDNIFAYTADSGIENLQFRIENDIAYEGI